TILLVVDNLQLANDWQVGQQEQDAVVQEPVAIPRCISKPIRSGRRAAERQVLVHVSSPTITTGTSSFPSTWTRSRTSLGGSRRKYPPRCAARRTEGRPRPRAWEARGPRLPRVHTRSS